MRQGKGVSIKRKLHYTHYNSGSIALLVLLISIDTKQVKQQYYREKSYPINLLQYSVRLAIKLALSP